MNDKIEMVTVPLWKMERAANALENDGDESGVARDIRYMIKDAHKPEAQAAVDAVGAVINEAFRLLQIAASAHRQLGLYGNGGDVSLSHETRMFAQAFTAKIGSGELAAGNGRLLEWKDAARTALATPASHDAQQPACNRPNVACSWPDCGHDCRHLAQQPAVVGDDGFRRAFYEIADVLEIGARPYSPEIAFQRDMLPRIRELAELAKGQEYQHSVAGDGVDLQQFRQAVVHWYADADNANTNPEWARGEAERLLAIIDAQAALTPAATPGDGSAQ